MPPARLAFIFLFAGPALSAADALVPEFSFRHSALSVVSENDKYFAGTDRHYTNGFKITWVGETDLNESQEFVQAVARFLPWINPAHTTWRYKLGFALGHNIYTPGDTATAAFIPDDRPYAGWLYGSMLLHAQRDNQLRLIEISLGVVGPAALGQQVQNQWHRFIHEPRSQGWTHQLRDEPGVQLSWERRYRAGQWKGAGGSPWDTDIVLSHRLTLGNVGTHLAGGVVVRFGWRLPKDFGADLIRPGGGNTPNGAVDRFSAYVHAGAEARAVARDIFLDGNTWRSSHSVDKRPVVGDLNLGFVCAWPGFQIAYTQNHRTKEFYGQRRRDVFGSIGFSFTR